MPLSKSTISSLRGSKDRWLFRLLGFTAATSGTVLLLILAYLLTESLPLLQQGLLPFLGDARWLPGDGRFGLLAMLLASLATAVLAVAIAAPAGIVLALWGRYVAPPPLLKAYLRLIELLGGIPSVVYGFWGLTVLVPWVTGFAPPGASLFSAALILALMILPLVTLSADSAFARLPSHYQRSASSLGISQWGMIRKLYLPLAAPAIFSAGILQLGRALGETMAVLMVAGNVVQLPESLFTPVRTLTANIALEMAYASGTHQTALFVSGLLLLVIVMLLMSLAHRVAPDAH